MFGLRERWQIRLIEEYESIEASAGVSPRTHRRQCRQGAPPLMP